MASLMYAYMQWTAGSSEALPVCHQKELGRRHIWTGSGNGITQGVAAKEAGGTTVEQCTVGRLGGRQTLLNAHV